MQALESFVASLGVCSTLISATALAGDFYSELGYTGIRVSGGGVSATPADAILRVGYDITKNFGVEVDGATSVSSANLRGVDLKVDSAYGAYLKGQLEVAPSLELFAKLGWMKTTLQASFMGNSASSSDSSFSYAAGIRYLFTRNWYAQADYASYYDKSGTTARGPSVTAGFRF